MAARGKRGGVEEAEGDANAWMVTFSDLLTLMITFFVLLLTMSSMDDKKLQNIFGAFNDALGVLEMGQGTEISRPDIFEIEKTIYQELIMEKNLIRNLLDDAIRGEKGLTLEKLQGNPDFEDMVSVDDRGVVITLSDAIVFEAGKTTISPEAFAIIDKLALHLKESEFLITVEGHTDSTPAGGGSSNWLISAKRAINIVRYLNETSGIEMERLAGLGYGEYRPLLDNSSAGNRAKNRRIEIVLSKRW